MAPGMWCWLGCWPPRSRPESSIGRCRWIPPSPGLIGTPRTSPATQGAGSNYNNPRVEPPDHGIGRSRGGLTSPSDQIAHRERRAQGGVSHAPARTVFAATRPTPAVPSAPSCAGLARRPAARLRPSGLQGPQGYRAKLQHRQAMAGPGHPLRQTGHRLPWRSRPQSNHDLAALFIRQALAPGAWGLRERLGIGGIGPRRNHLAQFGFGASVWRKKVGVVPADELAFLGALGSQVRAMSGSPGSRRITLSCNAWTAQPAEVKTVFTPAWSVGAYRSAEGMGPVA